MTVGIAVETQDLLTRGESAAACADWTNGGQPTQFAETRRFLAAAEHHLSSCPKNQATRQVTDAKGKSGRVATRAVLLQEPFEEGVGELVGAHGCLQTG